MPTTQGDSTEALPEPRPASGGWRFGLVELAVSGTLLWLIVRRFSFAELKGQVLQTDATALIVPFAIILASNLLGAVQWAWILRSAGLGGSLRRVLSVYFAGLFLNNFLLGSMGGDVYKIYRLGRGAGEMGRVAGATIVDRAIGLSALSMLALGAALAALRGGRVPLHMALLVLAFSVGIMACTGLLLHERFGEAASRRLEGLPLGPFAPRLGRLLGHLRDYRRRFNILNGAFVLSLVIQSSRVLAHYFVGLAMGWSLHPTDLGKFFLVIPILGLLVSLPVSIGGWGVREWAGVALFAPMGHAGQDAVTLLALTASLNLIASLVGGIVLLAHAVPAEALDRRRSA